LDLLGLDFVMVRNEFDFVKDNSPETLFAQYVWVFDFAEINQM
jgi:hypothetical protein